MRLGHVELLCKNCERTREFYVSVLQFEETQVQASEFSWLRSDGVEILLRPGKGLPKYKSYGSMSSAMVIYCSDLGSLADRLKELGVNVGDPDGDPDTITFQDPDGRWLQAIESY